jgi:16S rRNA (cytosine1402-N4)-methyltransferase
MMSRLTLLRKLFYRNSGVPSSAFHIPVLCREAVDALVIDAEGCYVDGTVGGGGHAEEICSRLRGRGKIICLDADADALASARSRLQQFSERTTFIHTNFGVLAGALQRLHVSHINGLLLDLGVSSHQFDKADRGFSFRSDERLDMRMDRHQLETAWDLVNRTDEKALAALLWEFGEERESRRIARGIVAARPVDTTGDLRDVVERAVGGRYLTKSLARVFQALRIAVNRELDQLRDVLAQAMEFIAPKGRLVVISYHSLEDRIVKEFIRGQAAAPEDQRNPFARGPVAEGRLRMVTRKPVIPADKEIALNPRARSAKMRVAERTDVGTERK